MSGTEVSFASGGGQVRLERFDGGSAPDRSGPGILLLHGADGLDAGGRYRMAAGLIASAGYHVFLVRYLDRTGETRVAYSTAAERFPLWVDTVRDALGFVGRQPDVDPGRLGIVGVSLGAALGLTVAASDPRVKALVDYFGFVPEGLASRAARLPPTLILHGARDAIVPVSNARALEAMLARSGVPHEIQIYPDQAHGLFGGSELDAAQRTAAFLAKHLAGPHQEAATIPLAAAR